MFSEFTRNTNKTEYLVPVLIALSLVTSCIIISSKKYFWNDELYSYYLLADESFFHMLYAFSNKINNTPPLYFILGWVWAKIFGASELSLRLFNVLGIAGSGLLSWIILRKIFGFWACSIGVVVVFCFSDLIIDQIAEARMYGLFLFVCTLGLLNFYSLITDEIESKKTYLISFVIHTAIVMTHIFGIVFSAVFLFSLIFRDKYLNIYRPKAYLSIIASWLMLLPYLPVFIIQSDAYVPRGWIPLRSFGYLINLYEIYSYSILPSLVLFMGSAILLIKHFMKNNKLGIYDKNNLDAIKFVFLVLSGSFIVLPILVWGFSYAYKPIFAHRYLMPIVLGWGFVFTYLLSEFFRYISGLEFTKTHIEKFFKPRLSPLKIITLIIILSSSFYPVFYAYGLQREQIIDMDSVGQKYKNLPVVVQFSHDYHKLFYYSNFNENYFFILDWEAALDDKSGLFQPQEFKHMKAFRKVYPKIFKKNIVYSKAFLKNHRKFIILDHVDYDRDCSTGKYKNSIHCPQWFENKIIRDNRYKVKPLKKVSKNRRLYLIEKRS